MKEESKNVKKENYVNDKRENEMTNRIETDPFGSWTGKCKNPEEMPVQDADDL